jgi:hypothetical protein
MKIRARMKCIEVANYYAKSKRINLSAVYSQDPADPNFTYSQATPSATLTMTVTNPDAAGAFEEGKTYDLTFEEATRP